MEMATDHRVARSYTSDRPYVADRNWRPGLWQSVWAWPASDQARFGDDSTARHRSRGGFTSGWDTSRPQRKRHHGNQAPLPWPDSSSVGRAGALQPGLLAETARSVLYWRLSPDRR